MAGVLQNRTVWRDPRRLAGGFNLFGIGEYQPREESRTLSLRRFLATVRPQTRTDAGTNERNTKKHIGVK